MVLTLVWDLALCSVAGATMFYQTDFEAAEGYAGPSLIGQNGWGGLSPINIQAAGVAFDPLQQPGLGQFGYIGGFRVPVPGTDDSELAETKQIVSKNIPYPPGVSGGNQMSVSMDLVPFFDDPSAFDQFGIVLLNSYQEPLCTVALSTLGSQLVVVDQLDEAGANAPGISYTSGSRYELRFELDFAANTWSAWFGGQFAASNRRLFTPGMAADLGSIAFTWGRYTIFPDGSANHYLIFDRLRVSSSLPATLDATISLSFVPGTLDLDLSIEADPGSTIILQYVPSLADDWEPLGQFMVPPNGIVGYRHLGVRSLATGFYRIASGPGG